MGNGILLLKQIHEAQIYDLQHQLYTFFCVPLKIKSKAKMYH